MPDSFTEVVVKRSMKEYDSPAEYFLSNKLNIKYNPTSIKMTIGNSENLGSNSMTIILYIKHKAV